jgi:hypothetical protein
MNTIARRASWLTGTAAATVFLLPAGPAVAKPYDPPMPPSAVYLVEVPVPVRVPVDDTIAEGLQMAVAAALGATLAAVTATRMHRRRRPLNTDAGIIDITSTVQQRSM